MTIDLKKFFRACNPSSTLNYADPEDRKYYIDFSSVRSGKLIRELGRTIILSDEPTCQLFTGHIGCGKSTELLRLKAELEEQNYHVVYFESSEDLDMGDIDITDILLVIARKISESHPEIQNNIRLGYFEKLFYKIRTFLPSGVDISAKVSLGFADITSKIKESPKFRDRLRDHLESRTDRLLDSINDDVLKIVKQLLEEMGKEGLVVIVDNLDRIDNKPKPSGRTQPEYVFIDRGEQLKKLNCHLVYTIPLTLIFSRDASMLSNRFGVKPKILSMVPVQSRGGQPYEKGIHLLGEMVMKRAFPEPDKTGQLGKVELLFEEAEMLDRLCLVSGGHVRNLLGLLFNCLQKEDPPFPRDVLNEVIREYRDDLVKTIKPEEWKLLRQVVRDQSIAGESESHKLLRNMTVFEYQDREGVWFGLNPLLAGMDKLRL